MVHPARRAVEEQHTLPRQPPEAQEALAEQVDPGGREVRRVGVVEAEAAGGSTGADEGMGPAESCSAALDVAETEAVVVVHAETEAVVVVHAEAEAVVVVHAEAEAVVDVHAVAEAEVVVHAVAELHAVTVAVTETVEDLQPEEVTDTVALPPITSVN